MKIPVQIVFRHVRRSEGLVRKIHERVAHLEMICNYLISCRVVVDLINQKHHQGNLFQVKVDIKLPRYEIASSRNSGLNHAHEDPYVAMRDAFDAVERQLQDLIKSHRVRVHFRSHQQSQYGKVVRILRGDGDYGFLLSPDGREIYFHKNSVLNNHFDQLRIGAEVRFVEEMGEQGPQASTVDLIDNSLAS